MGVMVVRSPKKRVATFVQSTVLSMAGVISGATVNYPASVQPGDTVIAFVSLTAEATGVAGLPTAPSGWTTLDTYNVAANNSAVFKKQYAASDGASVLFTFPSSRNWSYNISMTVLRNVNFSGVAMRGTPTKGSTSAASGTSPVTGVAVATSEVPSILLSICSVYRAGITTNTMPSPWVEQFDVNSPVTSGRFNMQTLSTRPMDAALASSTVTVTHSPTSSVCRYSAVIFAPTAA